MKYSNELVINLPLEKVITLFDSEENLFKWQPELLSLEHLSGEKGKKGPKTACWRSDSHFKFSGFMKLMGLFMPGAFKKQSQQSLDRFKAFAESSAA